MKSFLQRMGPAILRWFTVAVSLLLACAVSVTTEVTSWAHMTTPTDFMTLAQMTTADRVMSGSHLTDKIVNTSALGLSANGTESGRPQVHRLGILPTLSNEQTTAILKLIENERITFEIVNMTTPSSTNRHSYTQVVKEVKSQVVTVVIGPFHPQYSAACQHLRVPYLVTSQMPIDEDTGPFVIELFPNARIFARSVLDVLRYYDYKKVAVVYDCSVGATILELLLGQPSLEVTAFHLQQDNVTAVRQALKTMRDQYYVNFVSVLTADDTADVMEQALSLSLFSIPYKWILVNTGLREFSLEEYVDSRANITVLRLMMDYDSRSCSLKPEMIDLRRAILHDAVRVYVTYVAERENMSHRFSMRQANRQLEVDGCTGHLEFTRFGRRKESFLQLMTLQGYRTGQVTEEEFLLILDLRKKKEREEEENEVEGPQFWCQRLSGTWRSAPSELGQRVVPSRSYSTVARLGQNVFGDLPLRITTLIEPPFVQYREDENAWREDGVLEATTGRQLEGMCVDILKELSGMLGFAFNVSLVPDGKYGSKKPLPRGWTGMVRQLKDDKADVALAPFQMSAQRSEVVDFTKPFMTKGTTVVVRRPEQHLWIFQFLSPLSRVVWSAIFLSFIVVSLTLFGVSRVNSDRQAKYTSNFRESFWYIWGTLLRGSLNGAPQAISSRIVSSAWWFFCLIVTSIYTANLAAFLTITIGDVGINSASDLARQDYYAYGTVEGSQTETFFNHTQMTDYAKMWAHMSTLSPDSIVRRVENGFERVKEGKYAFIWDSPTIRHKIANDCDLMEIGSPFDNKGYGFAIQKHAPYGDKLSWALLKLNDAGILYRLERKWWRPQFCPNQRQSATTDSLNLETVAGMYLVLLAGIVMSITLCLLQFCLAKYRDRHRKTRKEEEYEEGKRSQEPCLKATDDIMNSNPETLQVYANHSPYTFRTYSATDW